MPRYLFHLRLVDGDIQDEDGVEYPDVATATQEARASLLELAADAVRSGNVFDTVSVIIFDTKGRRVAEILSEHALSDLIDPALLAHASERSDPLS